MGVCSPGPHPRPQTEPRPWVPAGSGPLLPRPSWAPTRLVSHSPPAAVRVVARILGRTVRVWPPDLERDPGDARCARAGGRGAGRGREAGDSGTPPHGCAAQVPSRGRPAARPAGREPPRPEEPVGPALRGRIPAAGKGGLRLKRRRGAGGGGTHAPRATRVERTRRRTSGTAGARWTPCGGRRRRRGCAPSAPAGGGGAPPGGRQAERGAGLPRGRPPSTARRTADSRAGSSGS